MSWDTSSNQVRYTVGIVLDNAPITNRSWMLMRCDLHTYALSVTTFMFLASTHHATLLHPGYTALYGSFWFLLAFWLAPDSTCCHHFTNIWATHFFWTVVKYGVFIVCWICQVHSEKITISRHMMKLLCCVLSMNELLFGQAT